jgi:hypothetical protein
MNRLSWLIALAAVGCTVEGAPVAPPAPVERDAGTYTQIDAGTPPNPGTGGEFVGSGGGGASGGGVQGGGVGGIGDRGAGGGGGGGGSTPPPLAGMCVVTTGTHSITYGPPVNAVTQWTVPVALVRPCVDDASVLPAPPSFVFGGFGRCSFGIYGSSALWTPSGGTGAVTSADVMCAASRTRLYSMGATAAVTF